MKPSVFYILSIIGLIFVCSPFWYVGLFCLALCVPHLGEILDELDVKE